MAVSNIPPAALAARQSIVLANSRGEHHLAAVAVPSRPALADSRRAPTRKTTLGFASGKVKKSKGASRAADEKEKKATAKKTKVGPRVAVKETKKRAQVASRAAAKDRARGTLRVAASGASRAASPKEALSNATNKRPVPYKEEGM